MSEATIEPSREAPGLAAAARSPLGTNKYMATRQQVSQARHWVRELLAPHVDDDTLFDITLCAGELVDNARKHVGFNDVITVSVYLAADTIRLEVMDDGSAPTIPQVTANVDTVDGRGLKIIAGLARRWGQYKDQDLQQIVWCEFSVQNAGKDERK